MIALAFSGILAAIAVTSLIWATIRDAERRGRRKAYLQGVFDTITHQGNASRFSEGEEL